MRDRLKNLHHEQIDSDGFSTVELDNFSEQAAAAESHQELKDVLQEAQQIRTQIQQIQNDIADLKDVNYKTLNQTAYSWDGDKRDSNTISADIKRRAEDVLQRLHMMNALRGELEVQRGVADPTVRIARTQSQCLSSALQQVMSSYNDTELNHQEACKCQIKRQMEVVGREVGEEELEEMMESESLQIFSDQMMGKTTHSALVKIENRHRELLDLQKRMEGIQDLFLDVALLVEEQGSMMQNIQQNVEKTDEIIQGGAAQLEEATTSDKNNPCKKLFCGCMPCYYN